MRMPRRFPGENTTIVGEYAAKREAFDAGNRRSEWGEATQREYLDGRLWTQTEKQAELCPRNTRNSAKVEDILIRNRL